MISQHAPSSIDVLLQQCTYQAIHLIPAGFCKQQLWPLFHYILPVSPSSTGRFDSELWQAYVKANKVS